MFISWSGVREKLKLEVSENKVLRKVFILTMNDVGGKLGILHRCVLIVASDLLAQTFSPKFLSSSSSGNT
jgi:hypothetical protein